MLDRFLREIRAVAKLRHPNIVDAYSAFRFGKKLVFAMEYVEGLDLAQTVKAKGPLSVAHACCFVHQAALGLQHAHEEGMVHRDIKPSNLMLRREARAIIKLLDFGLSKASSEQTAIDLGDRGPHLKPEAYDADRGWCNHRHSRLRCSGADRDAAKADIRADIYSLGCTLYYLLSGRAPFATTHCHVLHAHRSIEAVPLNVVRPNVSSELASLVAKMMAKKPDQRLQTPAEVARALVPFFSRREANANNYDHRFRRQRLFAIAGGAAILVGAAGLVAYVKWQPRSVSPYRGTSSQSCQKAPLLKDETDQSGPETTPQSPLTFDIGVQNRQAADSTPLDGPPNTNQTSGANRSKQVASRSPNPVPAKELYWRDFLYIVRTEEAVRKNAQDVGQRAVGYRQAILDLQQLDVLIMQAKFAEDDLSRERETLNRQDRTATIELETLSRRQSNARECRDLMEATGMTFYADGTGVMISVVGLDQLIASLSIQIDQQRARIDHIHSQLAALAPRIDKHSRAGTARRFRRSFTSKLTSAMATCRPCELCRESVDATKRQYGDLTVNPDVRAELASKNKGLPQNKFLLGPSPEFRDIEGKLRLHEDWVNSSALGPWPSGRCQEGA